MVGKSKDTGRHSNELLTLDVSKSFSIADPMWTSRLVGLNVSFHTISIGGSQNELLVLYGGEYLNSNTPPENPLFYYNTLEETPEWINANLSLGTQRKEHTAVTRLNDSMNYFFGGIPAEVSNPNVSAIIQFQDLFKLDTRENSWHIQNVDPNTPSGRFHHTATILDGKMYVIGGYSKDKLVDISQIYVYDTIEEMWNVQVF